MVIRFIINIVVCYILAYGVMKEFVRMLLSDKSIAIQDNIAMFMGMGVFVILNYLGQRFWAFKKEEAE